MAGALVRKSEGAGASLVWFWGVEIEATRQTQDEARDQ